MIKRILFLLCFFPVLNIQANNIRVDSLSLEDHETVSLVISWEHSWDYSSISPFNHDGAWLFLKKSSGGQWSHLDLSSGSADHVSLDSAFILKTVSDGKGILIKRRIEGDGNVSGKIRLKLSSGLATGTYSIRAFATEMVFIPEGDFFAGDSVSNNSLCRASDLAPWAITSENEILAGSSGNVLSSTGSHAPAANVPAAYPKGYESFYCMKYEISQEQYADFLNCLTYDQQVQRTASLPSSSAGTFVMTGTGGSYSRNGIVIKTPGNAGTPAQYALNGNSTLPFADSTDGQSRAANFLSWKDLTAYLDWAGLRAMTELEFEKICRGPSTPIPLELAWGTGNVSDANTILNDGTELESVSEKGDSITGVASHGYAGAQGPLRNGFNASGNSGRLESGAGYYGCFELSGNLWEQCIGLNAAGLLFTGNHGDGILSSNGDPSVQGWDNSGNSVCVRGGGWNSGIQPGFRDLAVSDRFYGYMNTSVRKNTYGGRGIRKL